MPRLRRVDHACRMADRGFPVHFFCSSTFPFHKYGCVLHYTLQYSALYSVLHYTLLPSNQVPGIYSDAPHAVHNSPNSPSIGSPVFNTKPNPVKARPLGDARFFLPSTILVPSRVFIFDLAMLIRSNKYRLGLQYTRSLSSPDPYRRMSGLPFGGKLGISPGPDFFCIDLFFFRSPHL